nr:probable LRR receptor-like serine/threonine-protein kinase At3g47570 [Ipomoea batatas]
MGSRPSKAGDVYSFGILMLEMLSGKRPTDELFQDGLNLHSYAKAALADRGVEIADPKLVQERDEQIQMCLVCMIKVGVACSVEFPAERMKIRDVVVRVFNMDEVIAQQDFAMLDESIPEYGFGSRPSKAGDVYSLGILILEMLTGRRPTDELFKDGLNLHSYAKAALPDRGIEIAHPKIVQETDDKFQVCLVSMITIGVACSMESPADRMSIHDIVSELSKAKRSLACRLG